LILKMEKGGIQRGREETHEVESLLRREKQHVEGKSRARKKFKGGYGITKKGKKTNEGHESILREIQIEGRKGGFQRYRKRGRGKISESGAGEGAQEKDSRKNGIES